MSTVILLPPGRIVQGHPAVEITKVTFGPNKGQPLMDMKGQPKSEYFCAIAIEKTNPQWAAAYAEIQKTAAAAWPSGESKLPGFHWKIEDGDDPKNAKKEGFPGHWVVKCKSGIMPMAYRQNAQKTGYDPMLDPLNEVKCGDYIWMSVNVAGNGQPGAQAGIFMNGYKYVFLRMGEAITSGPTAEEVFGPTVPSGPAGAAGTPAPDMSFLNPGPAPSPAAPPVSPAPATPNGGPVVTPKAKGMTWEALSNCGYTEETARAAGLIL